ncbi:MAG TPA: hypothetical protein VNR65_07210, partial [Geobacterales bacterium]|nr:hypothetical protein [Geobacterales bacterium]
GMRARDLQRLRPAAAKPTSAERDPKTSLAAPDYRARMDLIFSMDNQCELVRNSELRTNIERDAAFRDIAQDARD